jgi:pilus assembly protein FimV
MLEWTGLREYHPCMPKKRLLSTLIAAFVGLAASLEVSAIGFGRAPQSAVLGQPLSFTIELRLEPGETVSGDCVAAEVTLGDQRLPPAAVRTVLDDRGAGSAVIRITTSASVDEPVVAVSLSAGCTSQISRRFVLLADPPESQPAAPMILAVATEVAPPPVPELPVVRSTAGNAPVPGPEAGARAVTASSPAQPRERAAPREAARVAPRTESPRPARKPAAATPPPVAAGPRLKLDAADSAPVAALPVADGIVEEAIAAVAAAASSARAAAEAASASSQRIATLEQAVQTLRAQAQASQQEAALLRARGTESGATPGWLLPLVIAFGALAVLALWLAWRLRSLQDRQQRAWLQVASAEAGPPSKATAPIPLVTSEIDFPSSIPAPPKASRPAWPAPIVPAAADSEPMPFVSVASPTPGPGGHLYERTEVLPPNVFNDDSAPRDVSIDELLDLEQQADFFVVLGQDDSAIELLVDHLRVTGGGSPLPYLKLLEIYRRLGDRDAYERTRSRFNDRFNAYAPEWASDLQSGRTLDDYPGVLPRLQQVWPQPLDAMAELEALLFRKSRGELFELSAYREVLFLYSVARDLLEREPLDAGHVDLLLPLSDGTDHGITSPAPFLSLDPDEPDERDFGRPTAPLDLDIDLEPPSGTRPGLFDKSGRR